MNYYQVDAPLVEAELLPSQVRLEGNESDTLVIFTHGAGANIDSEFMQQFSAGLAKQGAWIASFNLPYMRANAVDGKRRPPDRAPKLLKDFAIHVAELKRQYQPQRIVLMGKSMGGRMAAWLANEVSVDGVVCLGYPFVALKGGEPRLAPLAQCKAPVMILQGERDKFGGRGQVETWIDGLEIKLHWLLDGDHSFKPRKSSGTTQEANLEQAIHASIEFIGGLDA
ncbi:dienelactone hydrolase [Shewanella sp. Scap07]|uniref:alpha/beta fold hydrolase n=1 Tax=Shewanella sp. Scap07 TaxID=2589987 RepID=UPI0015BBA509|nr:alpha/beta fold hydrolase [Shewanella sp. Scap07]QLE86335.1 dienelactone hydrolase [Shewanella sp. Scap07]